MNCEAKRLIEIAGWYQLSCHLVLTGLALGWCPVIPAQAGIHRGILHRRDDTQIIQTASEKGEAP